MSDSETNSKVLQNHQHVPSNHNTDQSKTLRTQCTGFCFKNKTQLTLSRKMTQIKKKKEWQASSGKFELFSKIFSASSLTIAKEKCQTPKEKS